MLGITTLSQSPIASLGGTNVNVAVTGSQLNISIGASTTQANAIVNITGSQLTGSIGNTTIDVITEVAVTGSQLTMSMGEENTCRKRNCISYRISIRFIIRNILCKC